MAEDKSIPLGEAVRKAREDRSAQLARTLFEQAIRPHFQVASNDLSLGPCLIDFGQVRAYIERKVALKKEELFAPCFQNTLSELLISEGLTLEILDKDQGFKISL